MRRTCDEARVDLFTFNPEKLRHSELSIMRPRFEALFVNKFTVRGDTYMTSARRGVEKLPNFADEEY